MNDASHKPQSLPPEPTHEEWLGKARTLSEALPYMRKYNGCTFVIKYGGHAMGDEETARLFARDVVLLKQVGMNPIVVHGGGPQINAMLKRLDIKSSFVDGLRVTDQDTVDVVEMVLAGSVNKELVTFINQAGGKAIGLSGKDGKLVQAEKLLRRKWDPQTGAETLIDLGFVGEPKQINAEFLRMFTKSEELIPVVSPIGVGINGETYNINADTVAGAIAAATGAKRLLMLTDVSGVLDKNKALIPAMSVGRARELMADGTISGGMIPKVETCLEAVENGVAGAVVLDGRVPHALLLEIFTEGGAGTLISQD